MNRERHAFWWATPPAILGPLVIAICVLVIIGVAVFVAMSRYQEAILTCAAGGFFVLVAVVDMLAEVVRQQKLQTEAQSGRTGTPQS
jgi:hypothetical protein